MNLGLTPRPLSVGRELWLLCRLRWQLVRNNFVSHVRQHYWRLLLDRKSTRLNSSHIQKSRMPSSA